MPARGASYFVSGAVPLIAFSLILTHMTRDRVSRYATGVMGGSGGGSTTLLGIAVESQDYRGMIQGAIKEVDETAKIVDPRAFIGVYLMQSIL